MKKMTLLFDTPQKVAAQLTGNPHLQDFLETLLTIKNHEERTVFESRFWAKIQQFPSTEQAIIRTFYSKIIERIGDFQQDTRL